MVRTRVWTGLGERRGVACDFGRRRTVFIGCNGSAEVGLGAHPTKVKRGALPATLT